jgi:hypothetical protein
MMSGIGSTIVSGMAFGTGSAIAHQCVRSCLHARASASRVCLCFCVSVCLCVGVSVCVCDPVWLSARLVTRRCAAAPSVPSWAAEARVPRRPRPLLRPSLPRCVAAPSGVVCTQPSASASLFGIFFCVCCCAAVSAATADDGVPR